MIRSTPIGPVLLAALLLTAGCLSGGPGAGTPEPTAERTPTTTPGTPTSPTTAATPDTPTPTTGPPTSPADELSVEYVVRAGNLSEAFETVTVTLRVVFVERTADLGPCYPEVFSGPYKPTLTPLPTPSGECERSEPIRIDLAELDGERSLGTFRSAGPARGHALVLTDINATRPNGSSVTTIKGMGGADLVEASDGGTYGVEIGVEAVEGRDYDYWLIVERFEPSR